MQAVNIAIGTHCSVLITQDRVEARLDVRIDCVVKKLDAVAAQGEATAAKLETVAAKLDAVAVDLSAHRADTEAHPPVYRVKE